MKIYKPGREVIINSLGRDNLKARIQSVHIGEKEVIRYELKYWNGLEIKTGYFAENEVRSGSVQHTIGFHDA